MGSNDKTIGKKKYIETAVLAILTVFLLIVFRQSKKGMLVIENQTNSLLSKYTRGLMPLNQKSQLNKEDIVNFALYGNIPLDKKNEKILIIDADENGEKKFVITKAKIDYNTNNYESLVSQLDLNNDEKGKIDKLLDKYRDKLYGSILLNENESYAINPSVIKLQSELSNKVNYFIDKSVKKNQLEIQKAIAEGINAANEINQSKEFIFINPDTVFNLVAKKGIKKKVNLGNKKFANQLDFSFNTKNKDVLKLDFQSDKDFVSVNVPQIPPVPAVLGKKISKKDINELSKISSKINNLDIRLEGNNEEFGFKFNIENIPPNVLNNLEKVDKDLLRKLENLDIKIDSLGMHVKIMTKDSSKNNSYYKARSNR